MLSRLAAHARSTTAIYRSVGRTVSGGRHGVAVPTAASAAPCRSFRCVAESAATPAAVGGSAASRDWTALAAAAGLLAVVAVVGDSPAVAAAPASSKPRLHPWDTARPIRDGRFVIIAGPGMETMAESLARHHPDRFRYFPTQWRRFPDNTDNIQVGGFRHHNYIQGSDVLFLASFHNNDVTMSQMHVLTMLGESFVNSLTMCLPFFPNGTMERVVQEGGVATANTLSKMFSHIPQGTTPNRLMMYDLHTLQNRFYFGDNTIATLHTAFPLIVEKIRQLQRRGSKVCIVFPDAGAEKRFGHVFDMAFPGIDTVICGKKRDPDDPSVRTVKILDGSGAGKHCLIIDDLVQTGGTLYNCGVLLKAQGAASVSSFCTHAVFPREAWRRFARGGDRDIFDKFYVTNSNPTVTSQLPANNVFEVLDIGPQVVVDLIGY